MNLLEQDALTRKVARMFESPRIQDRREKPSHGYRAVHIVVNVDGRPIETQIRTTMQDRWAQAMERLADTVGRGIRYGEEPKTRVGDVAALLVIAPMVASLEEAHMELQIRALAGARSAGLPHASAP